nr:leukocyte receptor cluster member 8 homolog isoform X2 [Cherax quadricarinatus]
MNNSTHGMAAWHGGSGHGQGGGWYAGPPGHYGAYAGSYNGPPGPPPPGWSGYGPAGGGGGGGSGFGGYAGYQAQWGYGVPPGMSGPPPTPQAENSANANTNNNKSSNSSGNSNNPPLPPGPPPAGQNSENDGQNKMNNLNTSNSNTPGKHQDSSSQQNANAPLPQHYNNQDYNQGYSYNPSYGPSYDNYSAYSGGWYGPSGPPPIGPPPNYTQSPVSRGNSPGISGVPVKFNLPSKKGLGFNALQQQQAQQQPQQPQSQQEQQQQEQEQQKQQHEQQQVQQQQVQQQQQDQQQQAQKQQQQHVQQQQHMQQQHVQQQHVQQQQHMQQQHTQQHYQQHNTGHNKKKNKKNKNIMLMSNSPWSKMQFLSNQQQHLSPNSSGGKENNDDQATVNKSSVNEIQSGMNKTQEPKGVKDIKGMTGLVANGDWPESLKAYVGRCFARCVTELDKDQVEICLKGKLTQAANNGTLWTKNWDEESLPSIHSESAVNLITQMKNWSDAGSDTSSTSPMKQQNKKSLYNKKQLITSGYSARAIRSHRSKSRSRSRSRSKSHSRSRSVSRSKSRSPMYRKGRRDIKRRHSSESEEENKGFIQLSSKRGRSPGNRGKGKKMKAKNKADCHFYSRHGRMSLDPEFTTSERLQKRAARFSANDGGPSPSPCPVPQRKKKQLNITKTISNTFTVDGDDIDWTSMHIIGTSTALEKPYLRLTAAPDPSTVRTVDTLKRSLEHIKRQWVRNQDYRYACDQLKSLRQDLTIQGVRDDFTVQVYETHSRIALEKGDHEEFNQCQSQLKQLYCEVGGENTLEFIAYRLLYYIFTKNTLDITSLLAGLTAEQKQNECISFSLKLRAAWSLGNYHRFFQLYRNAPKMAGYLVDWFADRERKQALRAMLKGYRPGSLDVSFIKSELALGTQEEWQKFESGVSLVYTDVSKTKIDCKKSTADVIAT